MVDMTNVNVNVKTDMTTESLEMVLMKVFRSIPFTSMLTDSARKGLALDVARKAEELGFVESYWKDDE